MPGEIPLILTSIPKKENPFLRAERIISLWVTCRTPRPLTRLAKSGGLGMAFRASRGFFVIEHDQEKTSMTNESYISGVTFGPLNIC